jgi:hypothetical protein
MASKGLILMLGVGAVAAVALASSSAGATQASKPGGLYVLDPGMPPELQTTVLGMLQSGTDISQMRALAGAIQKKYPYAANLLASKANALAAGGPGAGTYVGGGQAGPVGPAQPQPSSPQPQPSPAQPSGPTPSPWSPPSSPPPAAGAPPSSNAPPFSMPPNVPPFSAPPSFDPRTSPPQSMPIPLPQVPPSARWPPATFPPLPPRPSTASTRSDDHTRGQRQLAQWAQAVEPGTYTQGDVDGVIGPKTQRVTQRFQSWSNAFLGSNLMLDGLFGPQTYAALQKFVDTAAGNPPGIRATPMMMQAAR